jgi:hypothetical protein
MTDEPKDASTTKPEEVPQPAPPPQQQFNPNAPNPYAPIPGAGYPGNFQPTRSNTPIVFGVLHLLEFAYYVFFMINNASSISEYGGDFWVVLEVVTVGVGLLALPVAAVFLFMRKRIGYYITFGFSILALFTFIVCIIGFCGITGWSFAPMIIGFAVGVGLRYLYPFIAAMRLRPRIKIDLD